MRKNLIVWNQIGCLKLQTQNEILVTMNLIILILLRLGYQCDLFETKVDEKFEYVSR